MVLKNYVMPAIVLLRVALLSIPSLFLLAHVFASPARLCQGESKRSLFPSIRLEQLVSGLTQPVGLVHAGDGTGRLFIVEQPGTIRIWEKGRLKPEPFLDLHDAVALDYEMGLLGLAFHPRFRENHRLFINYTVERKQIETIIAEFRVGSAPSRVDRATERVLLRVPQPYRNHKGGHLVFGPDGYLYIGLGDGGSKNDPQNRAQDLSTMLGKMLRIDVDSSTTDRPYGIPPDNPFLAVPGARPEIWAYGLRNPWRYAFDPVTGFLYTGDVGQDDREEIDVIRKGQNYGWHIMEGGICTPGVNRVCDQTGLELPIHDHPRAEGNVVIGGFVYRGAAIPQLCGVYVFGDFDGGRIRGLRYNGQDVVAEKILLKTGRRISSFGEDEVHELYVVDYGGEILKIVSL